MRYKLTISFDGSAFCGWQMQKNALSVQGEVTRCARELFGPDALVTGASRTDAKVHARGFVCHVDTVKELPCASIVAALNHLLDPHVAVLCAEEVPDTFHARYSAVSKEYHYLIHNSPVPDPFLKDRAWFYPKKLDENRMNECAQSFVGEHDFSAFMATGSKITDCVRTIYSAEVVRDGDLVVLKIAGNGFLYNMVRIIAGTLVDIDGGRINRSVEDIILSRSRSLAGVTAPAHALYLYRVNY